MNQWVFPGRVTVLTAVKQYIMIFQHRGFRQSSEFGKSPRTSSSASNVHKRWDFSEILSFTPRCFSGLIRGVEQKLISASARVASK